VLLDRQTLRLLASNSRLREFNAEFTRSLQQVADVAVPAVSAPVVCCHMSDY